MKHAHSSEDLNRRWQIVCSSELILCDAKHIKVDGWFNQFGRESQFLFDASRKQWISLVTKIRH